MTSYQIQRFDGILSEWHMKEALYGKYLTCTKYCLMKYESTSNTRGSKLYNYGVIIEQYQAILVLKSGYFCKVFEKYTKTPLETPWELQIPQSHNYMIK